MFTLTDACLTYIANNPDCLRVTTKQNDEYNLDDTAHTVLLPIHITNKLFALFVKHKKLDDATALLFENSSLPLSRALFAAGHNLSDKALRVIGANCLLTLRFRSINEKTLLNYAHALIATHSKNTLIALDVSEALCNETRVPSPTIANTLLDYTLELKHLQVLNLMNMYMFDDAGLERICRGLPRLHTLNLARTRITHLQSLRHLYTLRCLSIYGCRSLGNNIQASIDTLRECHQLTSLDIGSRYQSSVDQSETVPQSYLDQDEMKLDNFVRALLIAFKMQKLNTQMAVDDIAQPFWENIRHIDFSGRNLHAPPQLPEAPVNVGYDQDCLRTFLYAHRASLQSIALVQVDGLEHQLVTDLEAMDINVLSLPSCINNSNDVDKVIAALKHYSKNEHRNLTTFVLHSLWMIGNEHEESLPLSMNTLIDLIAAGVQCMEQQSQNVSVTMSASASLYHLVRRIPISFEDSRKRGHLHCKGKFDFKLAETCCCYHRSQAVLARLVDVCVLAVAQSPKHFQLHKNVWLTLCQDTVINRPIFLYNATECCRVALRSFCDVKTADYTAARLAIAIVSILTPKISRESCAALAQEAHVIPAMLYMIDAKIKEHQERFGNTIEPIYQDDGNLVPIEYIEGVSSAHANDDDNSDITLRFTLSALWNLTDGSTETCETFVKNGGVETMLNILRTFAPRNAIVHIKALGLLNNICEVHELHSRILHNIDVLRLIMRKLQNRNAEVSYFAGGILAHLIASRQDKVWPAIYNVRGDVVNRADVDRRLACVILYEWRPLQCKQVVYRTFTPFLHLLNIYSSAPVITSDRPATPDDIVRQSMSERVENNETTIIYKTTELPIPHLRAQVERRTPIKQYESSNLGLNAAHLWALYALSNIALNQASVCACCKVIREGVHRAIIQLLLHIEMHYYSQSAAPVCLNLILDDHRPSSSLERAIESGIEDCWVGAKPTGQNAPVPYAPLTLVTTSNAAPVEALWLKCAALGIDILSKLQYYTSDLSPNPFRPLFIQYVWSNSMQTADLPGAYESML